MLDSLQNQLQLPAGTLALICIVALIAGMVRGFSGFGLSALVMAVMAVLIPPIALIPVCFILEATASLVMFRGGMLDGDRALVVKLITAYTLGLPTGLAATHHLPPDFSRLIALLLILRFRRSLQLRSKSHLRVFCNQNRGVYIWRVCVAGIATGLGQRSAEWWWRYM